MSVACSLFLEMFNASMFNEKENPLYYKARSQLRIAH